MQKASVAVKKITRKKSDSLDHEVSDSFKMPSVQVVHKPENIWDLATMHNFVQALYWYGKDCRIKFSFIYQLAFVKIL